MPDYSINDQVTVYLRNHSPAGLLGQVVDGPRAIIRQREIAWENPQPLEFYIHKTWPAIVLHYDSVHDQLELSLRLVERDPWKGIEDKYPPGKEVEGKVVGLIEGAAFVELEPGVEAFLSLNDLPLSPEQRIENWLWLNDRVLASVEDVIPHKRRLRINLNSVLAKRENKIRRQLWSSNSVTAAEGVTLAEFLPKDIRLKLLRMGVPEDSSATGPVLNVLLIEDDDAFAAGLQILLRSNGCQVDYANDAEKGLACVINQEKPYDLIITDWNLPGLKGHEFIKRFKKDGYPSRMVMILDPVPNPQPLFLDTLRQVEFDLLTKADVYRLKINLLSILRELREKRSNPEDPPKSKQLPDYDITCPVGASKDPDFVYEPIPTAQPYNQRLQGLLEQLKDETQASSVSLLRMDPGRSLPVTEASVGLQFSMEKAPPDIIYSPLGDVLLKHQEVRIEYSSKSSRLERLLALVPFHGFLGIPIPMVESASYGLILLKDGQGFTHQERNRAHIIAYLLAKIIQEQRLIQIFQPWQAQNLVGQIASSIIHEVDNKLGGIELLVDSLQEGLKEISRWPEKAEDATFLRELELATEGIANSQRSASELRNWYLGLTTTDDVQAVDLKKLTGEMLRAMKSQAQENNIFLSLKTPRHLSPVHARPSQLQQVFLNLILNAIQQMAELHRTGNLVIEISQVEDTSLPIQVRFKDDGPGIHKQLQERIFDFGFTTRKDGAGLGLTISRQIATSLKGQLRVEESHIFWGTTLLLELPKED
jgi:signal transduction histidine kinase/CheY-like chemotaxis protein